MSYFYDKRRVWDHTNDMCASLHWGATPFFRLILITSGIFLFSYYLPLKITEVTANGLSLAMPSQLELSSFAKNMVIASFLH